MKTKKIFLKKSEGQIILEKAFNHIHHKIFPDMNELKEWSIYYGLKEKEAHMMNIHRAGAMKLYKDINYDVHAATIEDRKQIVIFELLHPLNYISLQVTLIHEICHIGAWNHETEWFEKMRIAAKTALKDGFIALFHAVELEILKQEIRNIDQNYRAQKANLFAKI